MAGGVTPSAYRLGWRRRQAGWRGRRPHRRAAAGSARKIDFVGRFALVGEPLAREVAVGDALDRHLHVLAGRLHGDGAVVEHDLAHPLEQPAGVLRDAADGANLAVERHRLAEAYGELHGDSPRLRVG